MSKVKPRFNPTALRWAYSRASINDEAHFEEALAEFQKAKGDAKVACGEDLLIALTQFLIGIQQFEMARSIEKAALGLSDTEWPEDK